MDSVENSKKSFSLLHLTAWSMISSLLHLVGLRPRVYYTLTNFRGGGPKSPFAPPPSIRQCGYTMQDYCAPQIPPPSNDVMNGYIACVV